MLIYEGNLHKNIGAIYQLGAEKITFLPKPEEIRHIPEHFHHLGVVVGLVQGLVVTAEEEKKLL